MKDKKYKIYRLVDPQYTPDRCGYVRYVGKTRCSLKTQLSRHYRDSLLVRGRPGNKYLSLKGLEIQFIENASTVEDAKSKKTYWLGLHMAAGYDIVNIKQIDEPLAREAHGAPSKIKEYIESWLAKHNPPSPPEVETEASENEQRIRQIVLDLIASVNMDDERAKRLLCAMGKEW